LRRGGVRQAIGSNSPKATRADLPTRGSATPDRARAIARGDARLRSCPDWSPAREPTAGPHSDDLLTEREGLT
jgi:hypothetical protein